MKYDYLIVGAGLTGSVLARLLTDAGNKVAVLDRRPHIGGNLYDYRHSSGILIHKYGPHYFRTDSEMVWNFVNQYAEFDSFEACLKSNINGKLENWPVAASYISKNIAPDWQPSFSGTPTNFEEASLAMMPEEVYFNFVKGYTEKQWGCPANELSVELAGRFEIRLDNDPRLKKSQFQGLPKNGYCSFFENLLKDIRVILNTDYLADRQIIQPRRKTIFTGPLDEFFNFSFGKLKYRGQKRETSYHQDISCYQECEQVNFPGKNVSYVRILEWKHMMPKKYSSQIQGTVITKETPFTPDSSNDYEYPFPSEKEQDKYQKYYKKASQLQGEVVFCGRLAEYKYLDMDIAIENAFNWFTRITEK